MLIYIEDAIFKDRKNIVAGLEMELEHARKTLDHFLDTTK